MIKDIQIKKWYEKHKDQDVDRILEVDYAHLEFKNGADLYVTKHGLPFIENLKPQNFWTDEEWFKENSVRLSGTSSVYRVRTKKVDGNHKDIVVKWNRMGQEIPGWGDSEELTFAEFNSPFEEFSLAMGLRNSIQISSEEITIQTPLAIYVPAESVELWQSGRKEYRMQSKIQSHEGIILDMFRLYAVIYEWIPGIDAAQAYENRILDEELMKSLTLDSEIIMGKWGFRVVDSKPHHIIVRPKNGDFVRNRKGGINYALIDFELLQRTPEQEAIVKKSRRADYLRRQRDRFTIEIPKKFHPHLSHENIFGVEYVYGHVESTRGRLWVVGRDPYLFDYFLPERWENIPKTRISVYSDMFYCLTKDNIHLAWKASKVGSKPDHFENKRILEHGYNSPFEEVAISLELSKKGVATIYPRAIYMTENKIPDKTFDNSRYESHKDITTPDGIPILEKNHNYIIIWGYWNGPDEKLAAEDGNYYEGIVASRALREGIINQKQYLALLQTAKEKLLQAEIEDLNHSGNHLLISLDSEGNIIRDEQGSIEIRICNFDFLKR
jgi:hypothetical protein